MLMRLQRGVESMRTFKWLLLLARETRSAPWRNFTYHQKVWDECVRSVNHLQVLTQNTNYNYPCIKSEASLSLPLFLFFLAATPSRTFSHSFPLLIYALQLQLLINEDKWMSRPLSLEPLPFHFLFSPGLLSGHWEHKHHTVKPVAMGKSLGWIFIFSWHYLATCILMLFSCCCSHTHILTFSGNLRASASAVHVLPSCELLLEFPLSHLPESFQTTARHSSLYRQLLHCM